MHDGRIEQVGAPLEIYDRPANVFVAEFLGSPAMNMIAGEVGEGGVTTADGHVMPLPPGAQVRLGQRVIYGLRPEHLSVDPDGALLATVTLVEPAGWETHLHAALGEQELRIISTARVAQRPGDAARLTIAADRAHLFDAGTGSRL
jgi:multiple sugar transport system ATP-binding protein